MVKITITYEDGHVWEFNDVLVYEFYDKEFAESIAERELTEEELDDIQLRCEYLDEVTSESVEEVIRNVIGE